MRQEKPIERPIARRLILQVVLFSLLITIVSTGLQVYREYQRDLAQIDSDMERIRAGFLGGLTEALWTVDQEQVRLSLQGISSLRYVAQARVETQGEVAFASGPEPEGKLLRYHFPLDRSHSGILVPLGDLWVIVDLGRVYASLLDTFWTAFLSNAAIIFAIAILFFYLFQAQVTRHLGQIAAFARGLSVANLDQPLRLGRGKGRKAHDEIDVLAESLEGMREALRESYEALAEGENRFRELAEHVDAVFWVGSPDWRQVFYISPNYEQVWGRSREGLYRDPRSWQAALHPDDRGLVLKAYAEAAKKLADAATPADYRVIFPRYRIVLEDGGHRWISSRAFPVRDGQGSIERLVGIAEDVTERVEGELSLQRSQAEAERARARLSDAIDSLPLSVELYDRDDRLVLANQKALEFFPELKDILKPGVAFEEIARFSVASGLGAARSPEGERTLPKEEGERRVKERMERHGNPQGAQDVEWSEGHWFQLLESRTSEGGTVVAFVDITSRREMERQLSQALKMEAIGQLTGGLAHDFNNLLGIILGSLDLAMDEEAAGLRKEQLERAIKAAERGAALTHRLLAFSRQQSLQPKPIDPSQLVQDMLDIMKRTLGERIEIEALVAGQAWTAYADPHQLENALLNLALNARDAMPNGGKLAIEAVDTHIDEYGAAQLDVAPGDYVLFAVTDTGTGIPKSVMARAFDPFFTTKPVGQGSGLGLSMVQGFAKQSEGYVRIYSEEGQGTVVKIYLPRYRGDREPDQLTPESPGPHSPGAETILVVEDDTDLRTLVVNVLDSLGYEIMEAAAADSALQILGSTLQINLLLTDVVLPGSMNGRELARASQDLHPGLPVLFMSGYTRDSILSQGRLDEGVTLIQKPFRKADIAAAVRETLDRNQDKV